MSKPTAQQAPKEKPSDKSLFWSSPLRGAAAGLAAVFLLSFIEWVDLQIRLSPEFSSVAERLLFTSYLSLNLVVGLIAGFVIGLAASTARAIRHGAARALARGREPSRSHALVAWIAIVALGAILLNQQPQINDFALGLLREAEKFPRLGGPIVALETLLTYFVVATLLIAGSLLWAAVSKSASWPRGRRSLLLLALFLIAAGAYYLDSRIELQQYESTFHSLMFLTATATAMAICGIAFNKAFAINPLVITVSAILLIALVSLTFVKFDSNQNVKTLVFYRTTQAKQHFKLAQWALDFDRDGFSALLGGGDGDDRNASIHPAVIESIEDGLDNNCVGGDLSRSAIDEWQNQFRALDSAANPDAKRLNVIYFFIDTVRADRLGAYGYHKNTSPEIDKLAARSTVFENAYTPSPYTYEAAPKFMQSAYWEGHLKTWTESLAENGYDTILFPRRLEMLQRYVKGIGRTIDEGKKGLEETIDAAISVLGKATPERPFCAYIYVADPHRPYKRHAGFDFGESSSDLYDGEIAYTDFHLGRLFDWMEQSGQDQRHASSDHVRSRRIARRARRV